MELDDRVIFILLRSVFKITFLLETCQLAKELFIQLS